MAAYLNYSAYSATKICLSNLGESVYFELRQNVDCLVWEPGFVHSNLHLGKPPSGTIATDIAVSGALSQLGKERKTFGSLYFEFYYLLLWMVSPQS